MSELRDMAFLAHVAIVVVLEVFVRLEIRIAARGVEHREQGLYGVLNAMAQGGREAGGC